MNLRDHGILGFGARGRIRREGSSPDLLMGEQIRGSSAASCLRKVVPASSVGGPGSLNRRARINNDPVATESTTSAIELGMPEKGWV